MVARQPPPVTGQIMEAVLSGKYDLSRTAVLISQTGGGCRATNYIALIRKALKAKAKARVCARAITTKIQVILIVVGIHTKLNNALFQKLKTIFSEMRRRISKAVCCDT